MLSRISNYQAGLNSAFIAAKPPELGPRGLAERIRAFWNPADGTSTAIRLFSGDRLAMRSPSASGQPANKAEAQRTADTSLSYSFHGIDDCDGLAPLPPVDLSTVLRVGAESVQKPSGATRSSAKQAYRQEQQAYIAKMRAALSPRPLSEGLQEYDSTKDNPPNSQSARFGLKPEPGVYQYRLVSWGEAGCGIPLVNNPHSVRSASAPPVDEGFKRKKFTGEQSSSVSSARYKSAVQKILKAGLHNSHGLASRFLGPETSTNIAPATLANSKDGRWGQGEMQSHLEDALFRIESKTANQGVTVFLRCTDYLGKMGELRSRKIKVFLSEPVVDSKTLSDKGNVKETTLGTFYMPGMVNEPESSEFIKAFKVEVHRLQQAVEGVLNRHKPNAPSLPLEVRVKRGVCAQDLKALSFQKLIHGKQFRTNEGLSPVLQHPQTPSSASSSLVASHAVSAGSLSQQSEQEQKVFHKIGTLKENPPLLNPGEELWEHNEIEAVLNHIRNPHLERLIKAQSVAAGGSAELDAAQIQPSFSRSSSEASLSSLSTTEDGPEDAGQWHFDFELEPGTTLSKQADPSTPAGQNSVRRLN